MSKKSSIYIYIAIASTNQFTGILKNYPEKKDNFVHSSRM